MREPLRRVLVLLLLAVPPLLRIPLPSPPPSSLLRVRSTPLATLLLSPLAPLYVAPTMGGSLSKAMGKIFGNREMRILMLGLDAAGKTSA
jgi:hypothetical protein